MDTLKYQTEILKGLYKEKISVLYMCSNEKDIYISIDKYTLHRIPKDKFFIDVSRWNEVEDLKAAVNKAYTGNPATKVTKFDKTDSNVKGGIGTALALYGEDDNVVYVDYNLIKPFEEKKAKLTFTINSRVEAVGVWNNGEFAGVVLPFRYNKNGVNPMENEREYYE